MRALIIALMLSSSVVAGCGDSEGSGADGEGTITGSLMDGQGLDASADVADSDVEPIYPGNPCQNDEQCSTGLCWGQATNQGVFEQPMCQLSCVPPEDFAKFCDSDADCCRGTCCIGCGWREGICVVE